ncbi:GxxExxY protein [Taibaiella lutea]|uniref:GxxExxY protein n=1 Tax=Taibaiella lutea TaxID=2608001 RepID=A0A5M6CED4_9BACT|nr:GxxExxY protein [Taibaiella lutea]KAA5533407.1 GxxExxY protein [Taibaiella lutea]
MDFENEIAAKVLNICFDIHKAYGPGLFESVYEKILCYELGKHNLEFVCQYPIEVIHDNVNMELGFRADIIIEDAVLIELKSISRLEDVHFKQVITYLKLTKLKLGLLINFNEALLKNGIKRVVNSPF